MNKILLTLLSSIFASVVWAQNPTTYNQNPPGQSTNPSAQQYLSQLQQNYNNMQQLDQQQRQNQQNLANSQVVQQSPAVIANQPGDVTYGTNNSVVTPNVPNQPAAGSWSTPNPWANTTANPWAPATHQNSTSAESVQEPAKILTPITQPPLSAPLAPNAGNPPHSAQPAPTSGTTTTTTTTDKSTTKEQPTKNNSNQPLNIYLPGGGS